MIYWGLQYQALLAHRWWWIGTPVIAVVLLFLASTGFADFSAERRGRQRA